MRSNSKYVLLLVAVAAVLIPASACKQKVPAVGAYPANAPDRLLIHNLEYEGPPSTDWPKGDGVNPNLQNLITPVSGFSINPPSSMYHVMDSVCFGQLGCTNRWSVNMSGLLHDYADGTYPSYQLRLGLKTNVEPYYFDMSFFSGIKFYLKMPNGGDTVLLNNFNFNLSNTTPVLDGGECDNSSKGCYNNFAVKLDYTSGWILKSFAWGEFTRETWGIPVDPPTLSGENLKRVVNLEWQSKRNNVAGDSNVNLSVDEIRFY